MRCGSPALVRTTTPTLIVQLPGPAGALLETVFEVRSAPPRGGPPLATGSAVSSAPGDARWQVPAGVLTSGSAYAWRARAFDGSRRASDWTAWQSLSVDTVAPAAPAVSSTQYPERQWGAVLGTPGTFTFTTGSVDTVDFAWSVNGGPVSRSPATGPGPRTASVTFTPTKDLVNVLTVQAVDAAGNSSTPTAYEFWVTPPPVRFAHWTLDETGGTTAADSGTLSATATLSGEVAFGPGYVGGGNGAVFTGAGGRIATAGPVLDTTASFTVLAWVNLADPAAGDQTALSQDGTETSGFELGYVSDANGGAGGWCVTVRTADSPGAAQAVCDAGAVVPGQWTHLAARYDAIAARLVVFVMGGETSCSGSSAGTAFTSTWSAPGPFVIGAARDARPWRGGIDDVYAHQRALSETAICQQASQ